METRRRKRKLVCLSVCAAARMPLRHDTAFHQSSHSQIDYRELPKSRVQNYHVFEPFFDFKKTEKDCMCFARLRLVSKLFAV